jgi:SAM-dependent methyltransferase
MEGDTAVMQASEEGRRVRRQDVAFYASVAAVAAAGLAAGAGRRPGVAAACGTGAVVATLAAKAASRRHPEPLPYAQRWMLLLTRPFFPAWALRRALAVRPGERLLEIGPGTGRHALALARALGDAGRLDVLDVQPEMVDAVAWRAARRGLANLHATVGDAHHLPWPDATFDGAYLVTVLGEIPDRRRALAELHRVVRPGGRVVVGEMLLDPDNVPRRALHAEAGATGFRPGPVARGPLTYLGRLDR